MNKLLIICGPTATGKTKLGIKLAGEFNGEIVSADSRQVYRGMDVGTGKEVGGGKWEMCREVGCGRWVVDGISIWLTDVVEPDYKFNVADYKKCADIVIEDIWKRGKIPIIVGGTGFYIKALTEEIETIGVEPDWELRERLSHCSIVSLLDQLNILDPERCRGMNESDRQNPRRLIRAIEIATWKLEMRNGKKDNDVGSEKDESHFSFQYPASHFQSPTSTLFIGLKAPNEILYQRIDQRVDKRAEEGIEKEIRVLLKKGYNWENSALGTTIAYKEWKECLEKVSKEGKVSKVSKETRNRVTQKWKFDEHDYASRQMTWFRKNKKINWFDITRQGWENEVELLVNSWYS